MLFSYEFLDNENILNFQNVAAGNCGTFTTKLLLIVLLYVGEQTACNIWLFCSFPDLLL